MASTEIRDKAEECLTSFKLLLQIEAEVGEGDKAEEQKDDALRTEDHLARFRIWAGNIGVFASGHASLDHRLKGSEDLRQDMLEFLCTLQEFLRRATEALRPDSALANFQDGESSDDFQPSVSSAISSSFRGTETESVQEELSLSVTPLEKRLQGVERTIDALYRLSVLIRQPSMANQNRKAEDFKIKDLDGRVINEEYEDFVRQYVAHRLPKAPKELQDRLARGVVVRRKRVLYRQSHQRKLTNDTADDSERKDQKQRSVGDDHELASTATARAFNVADSDLMAGLTVKNPRGQKRAPASQTSASALPEEPVTIEKALEDEESRPSTTFTNIFAKINPVPVPDPPKPVQNSKEFECPYCCIMLPIKEAKALRWRRHVMDDLEPYACVFEKCNEDKTFFRDRSSWVSHMQTCHTSRWICTSSAHALFSFQTGKAFEDHLSTNHAGAFTESQLPILVDRAKSPAISMFIECPLCQYIPSEYEIQNEPLPGDLNTDSKEPIEKLASDLIIRHLASHLESLSVFALPWQDKDERISRASSQSNKAEEVSTQSEDGSKATLPIVPNSQWVEEEQYQDSPITSPSPDPDCNVDLPLIDYYEDWGRIPWFSYHGHDRDPILQPLLRHLFLNTSSSTDTTRGPTLPAFIVPVSRNKNFFGRQLSLNAMRQALCPSAAVDQGMKKPQSFPRTYTVYGPGGMGKTQIAAEFVSQHRGEFDAVLWVRAGDSDKIAQDFKDIAVELGLLAAESVDAMDLSYARDVLKRWLVHPLKDFSSREYSPEPELASWLLVFDGVGSGDVLNEVWPYDGPGSILITSRNPHSWSTSLELKPWNTSAATGYIFNRTGIEASDEEKSAAITIANRLGGLPLALSHVAGIVIHQEITLKKFVQFYGKREGDEEFLQWSEIDAGPASVDYGLNVASVWAFDSLGPGALLINALSLLDPDGVPEKIFTSPRGKKDCVGDVAQLKEEYDSAREELVARSLITENKREQKLTIHKLVQEASRSKMRPAELRRTFLTCVGLISGRWPFEQLTWRHGTARWSICEELFPHVQKLKALFPTITPAPDSFDDYGFARLLIDAGWYLHERGNSADAIFFNNMAQSICESFKLRILEEPESASGTSVTLAGLNYSLAEILHNRGCIALEINEPSDALHYHRLFNDRMVKQLSGKAGEKDMRLAISWNELGNAYMLNDNWATGEDCFLKSIEEMKRLHDYNKTTISLPLANLGLSYWLQNKLETAARVLVKGLEERADELGEDDKVSFISGRILHAIGNVRGSQGRRDESYQFHRRLLLQYKATLGNRHHRTADAFSKVGEHHILQGQHETALALLDAAQSAYSLSNNFEPEKMRAIWFRVRALNALGRAKEAEAELAKCFQIYSRLMAGREEEKELAKRKGNELTNHDIDRLIAFWSR